MSNETQTARAALAALVAEQKDLPARIRQILLETSADREAELNRFYDRRDALPRLIDLARIAVLDAEITDLEAEAAESRQRREVGRPLIAAATAAVEEAKKELIRVQRQWSGLDTDLRYANTQLAAKRREMSDLIAVQIQEKGTVVRSTWQMS